MEPWTSTLRLRTAALTTGAMLLSSVAFGAAHDKHVEGNRNFDARIALTQGQKAAAAPGQLSAVADLQSVMPDVAATFDETTGVTRTLYNQTGYLTGPSASKATPIDVGMSFVVDNLALFGLNSADLAEFEVTDDVFSQATGASHIYLRQMHQGLPVYNGQLHFNVNRDGRLISVNNAFLPGLASAAKSAETIMGAAQAVRAAALDIGIPVDQRLAVLSTGDDLQKTTMVSGKGISFEDIEAKLMWLPIQAGDARLVWNFQIQTLDSQHYYDITVDAANGQVWTKFDWTNSGSYRVYEQPVESPIHTSPLPPSDARTLVVSP